MYIAEYADVVYLTISVRIRIVICISRVSPDRAVRFGEG